MATPTGRLSLAPDEHSDTRAVGRRPQDKRKGPAEVLLFADIRSGAGPTPHQCEQEKVPVVMTKATRSSGLQDSRTPDSAVKITPASAGPVPSTSTTA
jgi:hypothetical protein